MTRLLARFDIGGHDLRAGQACWNGRHRVLGTGAYPRHRPAEFGRGADKLCRVGAMFRNTTRGPCSSSASSAGSPAPASWAPDNARQARASPSPDRYGWAAGKAPGSTGSGPDSGVGWRCDQGLYERSSRYPQHGSFRRPGDHVPRLSRIVSVSGIRFNDLLMCSRQRGPISSALA